MKDIFPYVRRLHEGIIACYNTFMWLILSSQRFSCLPHKNILMRVLAVKSDHPRTFSFIFNLWGTLFALLIFAIERPSMISITQISWLQILLIGGLLLDTGSMNELIFSEKTSGCIDDRRPVPSGSNHSFYWCNYISS